MTRAKTSIRDLPWEVRALVGVGFMVALGFGIVAPAIPLFAKHFGVSGFASGAVISAFAFARIVTAPFVGRAVNAFGERVVLATGIGVVAVSSALAGLSQSYWELFVLRGIGGVGSIMFSVSAAGLLIRVTPSHQRGQAQGLWAGSFLIGLIAGPGVGSLLGGSFSLRAPFFIYAGTLIGAGTIGLASLRHSEMAARQTVQVVPMALRAALADRAYIAALAASFVGDFAIVGSRTLLVPLFVTDQLGYGKTWVYAASLVVSIVSGALLLPFGRFADSRGRRSVVIGGLIIGAAGYFVVAGFPTAAGLLVAMALLGFAGAADSVAPGAILGDVVGGRGGTVVAVFQMAGDLGAILGPLVAGWVADGPGYSTAFVVSAVVSLVPIPLVLAARETLVRTAELAKADEKPGMP